MPRVYIDPPAEEVTTNRVYIDPPVEAPAPKRVYIDPPIEQSAPAVTPVTIPENPPTPIADALSRAGNAIAEAFDRSRSRSLFEPSMAAPDSGPIQMAPTSIAMAAPAPVSDIETRAIQTDQPTVKSLNDFVATYGPAMTQGVIIRQDTPADVIASAAADLPVAASQVIGGASDFAATGALGTTKALEGVPQEVVKQLIPNADNDISRQILEARRQEITDFVKALGGTLPEASKNVQQYYTGVRPEETYTDVQPKGELLPDDYSQRVAAKAKGDKAKSGTIAMSTPGAKEILATLTAIPEFAGHSAGELGRLAGALAGGDVDTARQILTKPFTTVGIPAIGVGTAPQMGIGLKRGTEKMIPTYEKVSAQTPIEAAESMTVSDQNLQDTVRRSADYQAMNERNPEFIQAQAAATKYENKGVTRELQNAAKERKANVVVPETGEYFTEIRENGLTTKDEVVGFYKARGENINRQEAARRIAVAWPDVKELEVARDGGVRTAEASSVVPPEAQARMDATTNYLTGQTQEAPFKSSETPASAITPTETQTPVSEAGNAISVENNTAPSASRVGLFGTGTLQTIYDSVKRRISNNANNAKLENYLKTNLDPTLRENIKAAEGIDSPSILSRVVESLTRIKNEATRHFPDLDEAKYPELANTLRVFEDAGDRAKAKAYYLTKEAVKDLNESEYSVFRDNLVLEDLKRGVESGLYDPAALPFGFDEKSLDAHLKKVSPSELGRNPDLAESAQKVQAALDRRNNQMREIKSEAVRYKLLPDSVLNDDRYFHHQVLEYMNMKDNSAPGVTPSDVRVGGPKGYRKARTGSLKDFNTEYTQAEWEVLSQMLKDVETAATLEKIKKLDITEQLKREAEAQGLPKTADTLQQLAPEGYTTWQPEKGNKFFKAFTIPERIVDEILKKNDAVDIGMDDITTQKIVGTPKETWIIPEDVVKTLDGLREKESTPAIVEKIAQPLNAAWKAWQLLSPSRATNYMFTNFIGDADALAAYAPKAFTKLPQAIAEIFKNDRVNNKTLEEAYAQSVIGTGQTAKEIADVDYASVMKGLKASDFLNPVTMGKKYFEKIAAINNFRENALRYAVFKDFKERIAAGERDIYGASDRKAIDAITDPTEKAAKLTRDLMGDYGNISAQGEYLAKNWIPFYRWMEINTPRYYRMMKNAPFEGGYEGALKGGAKMFKRFLQMNALGTVLYQLYHRSLGAATGEDELQKARDISKSRNQLHTIIPSFLFPNDVKNKVRTLRLQGAFSDVTDMIFGTSDLFSDVMDIATNRTTFKEKAKELGWSFETPADLFNIPAVRKYTMAATPIARTVAELSLGKAFGKNWGESRPIRDPYQHIARSVALGAPYDIMNETPREKSSPADLVTYKTDIGEVAYNEMMKKKRDFMEEKGVGMSSMTNTPAGDAFYNLKRAYRYDRKLVPKYLKEYNAERAKLGQKEKDFAEVERQMRESADPRKFDKDFIQTQFFKTFTKEDKRKWVQAIKWYKDLYGE